MNPPYVDFSVLEDITRKKGVDSTIRMIYKNRFRWSNAWTSKDVSRIYDSSYQVLLDSHPVLYYGKNQALTYFSSYAFEYIRKLPHNLDVMDFGCGTGDLSIAVGSLGHRVVGVDYADEALNRANQKIELSQELKNNVCFIKPNRLSDSNKFDVIIMSDVIEHLSRFEALEVLKTLHANAKNRAILILHTPNGFFNSRLRYWLNIIHRCLSFRKKSSVNDLRAAYYDQTHLHLFSPKDMRALLFESGFEIKKMDYRSQKNFRLVRFIPWIGSDIGVVANFKTAVHP